jgi:holin-like protein
LERRWVVLAVLFLLGCQLGGEAISQALHLPLPGPVLGMVFLACALMWRGRLPVALAQVADFLLRHLSLFFVPAAVGVVAQGGRIARESVPLGAAILVSTALTIVVTGVVFQAVDGVMKRRGGG